MDPESEPDPHSVAIAGLIVHERVCLFLPFFVHPSHWNFMAWHGVVRPYICAVAFPSPIPPKRLHWQIIHLTHNKEHGTPAVHGFIDQGAVFRRDYNSPGMPTLRRRRQDTRLQRTGFRPQVEWIHRTDRTHLMRRCWLLRGGYPHYDSLGQRKSDVHACPSRHRRGGHRGYEDSARRMPRPSGQRVDLRVRFRTRGERGSCAVARFLRLGSDVFLLSQHLQVR